jgi:hypothetical protein
MVEVEIEEEDEKLNQIIIIINKIKVLHTLETGNL